MIETDDQRRWWFATHPQYSWSRTGQRKDRNDEEESERPSPEEVDAHVDERLKHERDPVIAELLRQWKFWFGTEFESKSPEEKHALLWDDDEPVNLSAEVSGTQQSSGHPAASRDSYDQYENVLDAVENQVREENAERARNDAVIPDPHTALDVSGIKKLFTSPVGFLKDLLRSTAKDTIVNATKKEGTRWKVGNDHLTPTSKGVEPSWTTQARRYWKNEAAKEGATEKWTAEDLANMKGGKAPRRKNFKTGEEESMELHHTPKPQKDGGKEFIEAWPEDHAAMDPQRGLKKR